MNHSVKNRLLSAIVILLLSGIHYFGIAQTIVKPAIVDRLYPAFSAQMNGFVGGKLDDAYRNRIMAQDVERLIAPFKNKTEVRCWQSEFWGKWFTSAVLAYRYHPEPKLKNVLDQAVAELMATQTPDGYIGNYTEDSQLEQWDIWGRKYCMLGLLAYHDLTKDDKSLQATRKLADHLMKELADKKVLIVKKGNHRGMAATSVLEPICLLYARTGDKRYLDFAEEIVRQWETPDGPQLIAKADIDVSKRFPKPKIWFGWDQGQKAYEMMSCYEGLLELYRLTGKSEYREAVEKTWENIKDTEINITGSGSGIECWFGGKSLQTMSIKQYQETCVTVTWIKLSQQLFRLTGDTKYADAIERSYYNALLGAMKPDGSNWAVYTPVLGIKSEGGDQCQMGINCCVASGPRGLFSIPLTTVMGGKDGLYINFFNSGTYSVKTPGGQTALVKLATDYPENGRITISIELPKMEVFPLHIRIPEWSKKTLLAINDKTKELKAGAYITVTDKLTKNDKIVLELDMRGRIEEAKGLPSYLAILRGPIVLSRDKRMSGTIDIDEIITPQLTKDGFVDLDQVKTKEGEPVWMTFKISCLAGTSREGADKIPISLEFCDYASAGNTFTEHSRFRIWFPQLLDPQTMNISTISKQ